MFGNNLQPFALSGMLKLVFGIFIFLQPVTSQAEDYGSLIEKGDRYYELFDNQKALEEYEKAYTLSPDSFEALMKLTRAYNDVGEDLKGIKFRSEDSKSGSEEVEEHFNKAADYAKLLREKFPDKAESYFFLAVSYGHLALFKGGKEKVKLARDIEENSRKAIELNPQFVPSYIVLGVYYRQVADLNWVLKQFAKSLFGGLPGGTNEDSERTLLKAAGLNPEIIFTHFELAKTYDAMKKKDKVAEELRKILTLPVADHQDDDIKAEAEKELGRLARR